MEAVMVEVLSRFGQVRSRHRLSTFPATLGRAPTCDVILDEPDVSAVHAQVVRNPDGSLTLEDRDSSNGVRFQRRRTRSVPLGARTDLRLGSAHVRFVSLTEPVPKTQLFRLSRLDRLSAVGAALVAFFAAELFTGAYLSATRVRVSDLIEDLLVTNTIMLGGWVMVWSIASRVAQGRSRALGHFAAALIAAALIDLCAVLPFYAASILRLGPPAAAVLRLFCLMLVLGWLLFQSVSRVVSWSPRRLRVTIATMAALATVISLAHQYGQSTRYTAALPLYDLQPPPALLIGPAPPGADLEHRIAALQKKIDAEKLDR